METERGLSARVRQSLTWRVCRGGRGKVMGGAVMVRRGDTRVGRAASCARARRRAG